MWKTILLYFFVFWCTPKNDPQNRHAHVVIGHRLSLDPYPPISLDSQAEAGDGVGCSIKECGSSCSCFGNWSQVMIWYAVSNWDKSEGPHLATVDIIPWGSSPPHRLVVRVHPIFTEQSTPVTETPSKRTSPTGGPKCPHYDIVCSRHMLMRQ